MKIWMLNHYASKMFSGKAGRHYWFARELMNRGYEATIFAASTVYQSTVIEIGKEKYKICPSDGMDFVFVKTRPSVGNGFARIASWIDFYRNIIPAAKAYAKKNGKPNVIIASSVHPLTLVAGIKIAKRLHVPCICEVRDLWPEAIFQFGMVKSNSIIGHILTAGEHLIYKKADALIFTKEGDKDYLIEKRWTVDLGGDIDLSKCYYINNGVDIASFDDRKENDQLDDVDLLDGRLFNVTYTGAIRPVNNVGNILDAAIIINGNPKYNDIRFLIYGDGDQLEDLKRRVSSENITNVKIKGSVERKFIPFILNHSKLTVLNYSQTNYNWKRGNSSNKLFEYMASGKPVISTVNMGYSIIKKYECGVELDCNTPEELAKQVILFHDMPKEEYEAIGQNARRGAFDFDYVNLTSRLETVIKSVVR